MATLSLFFVAVGAILRFAVSDQLEGVDLTVVGVILMIVGGVGLIFSLTRRMGSTHSHVERYTSADGRRVVEDQRVDA